MRDDARDLDGKSEPAWNARGPPLERRGAMRAIESGIDLHVGKHLRIPREVGFARREAGLLRPRNAPSCGPDVGFRRHIAILGVRAGHSVGARRQLVPSNETQAALLLLRQLLALATPRVQQLLGV